MPSAKIVHPSDLTEQERDSWSAIAASNARYASAFFDWRFADAVGHVNPEARVAVFTRDGAPVAFLPFQWQAGWLGSFGVAERIGGEINDYFGLVARDGLQLRPEQLLAIAGIPALSFSHLDDTQTAIGLSGVAPRIGLRIDLSGGGEAYLADQRKNKKSVVRETDRRFRRLAENIGPVRLEIDLRNRADILSLLIDAKLAQYDRTGKADPLLSRDWARNLLFRLYDLDSPTCRGQLSALYAGDTWVAFHFGLRHAGTLHYWFPVYNPEMASYGPGRLLLQKTIENGADAGLTMIDRGEGDSAVKREYANCEHVYYKGLWRARTVRGLVAGAAQQYEWRRKVSRESQVAKAA